MTFISHAYVAAGLELILFWLTYIPGPQFIGLDSSVRKCKKSFTSKDIFLDLTVTSGTKEYSKLKSARTELFSFRFFTREDAPELQPEWLPWL
jgi:hypothetical protein